MKIKKISGLVIILLFIGGIDNFAQVTNSFKVSSPDKTISLEVGVDGGKMMYRIFYSGNKIVKWSDLGFKLNDIVVGNNTLIRSNTKNKVREKFPWRLGEDDIIYNYYNELRLECQSYSLNYSLITRVYDGSVAFRFEVPEQNGIKKYIISRENTVFNFSMPLTIFQYLHESVFTPIDINLLEKTCDFPATLTSEKYYISLGDADNGFYTKAELRKGPENNSLGIAFYAKDTAVVYNGPFKLPWRTISISESAIGLHKFSQLYLKLAVLPANGIPAWIKPGKLIRAQLTTQAGLDCINFAEKHNFKYIMYDAGWYGAEFRGASDPTKVIPEIDMQKVIDYGKSKGIGVVLYVNQVGLRVKLDTLLPLFRKWGVSGIKFGFVDASTQTGRTWVTNAIKKVNDAGFILNIHDNYRPTGLSRTYPALLTQEGIRGDENSPDEFHTTVLPFTRFLAGPADFTYCFPNSKNSYSKNIKVSKAQQLALTVVYFSPLQAIFWYGNPNDYINEDEIEFFKLVPTVWNESYYLVGDIGKNISVARRNGNTWFMGNSAGSEDWEKAIRLDFLTKKTIYLATIYEDDQNGGIKKSTLKVKKGDTFTISLKAKGGQAIMMEPVTESRKKFVHPGILHTKASLDLISKAVKNKSMPQYGSYELLRDNRCASSKYVMNGPYPVISRDGQYSYTKSKMESDFSAVYLNALMWSITKDESHAKKSLEIMEAYADTLRLIPSTNDAPLLVGLEGTKIVNGLEILRYTYKGISDSQIEKITKMLTGVFIPVCEKFYSTKAYTNGNWGPIVTKFYISMAIFLDNEIMYKKAIDFYYNGNDNGTIKNYISGVTGQIQESGRDQGHSQLGIGALATVCEIAWNQGNDLYGALDNRLLKGFEYVAKYNLGHDDVPFETWTDITGKYSKWTKISEVSRGRLIPIYEMVYNHYVLRKGLSMPYTEEVIKKIRPEGYNRDQPAFGTLLFYGTGR